MPPPRRLLKVASLFILSLLLPVAASAQRQPPPAPGNVSATPGKAKITVSWGASADADGYNVFRSMTGAGGSFGLVRGSLTTTSFDDTAVSNDGTYYYYVLAYNTAGGSPNSSTVSTTLTLSAPSPTARGQGADRG
jgi:fibronectin type 3 domain-containing protein